MTRNELLRKYVEYGWTIVPVKHGAKSPAVNWKKYQTQKPTTEELRAWFSDPNVGVGLITGEASGVDVIDEDSYKEQGKKLNLETPLIVETGRGGRHYYFKHRAGVTNTVNKENAVDSRGEGGFVVLPPTIHPTSQKPYEWRTVLPDNLESLPSLDESVAQEFARTKDSSEPLKISDYVNLGSGSRDDSLHRVACSLLRKFDTEEALSVVGAINQTYDPPLPPQDVERIFNSASRFIADQKKEEAKQKPKTSEGLEILDFPQAETKHSQLMEKYGAGVTTGYKLLDEYFKFIPQQLYMVSAPTHVGKTTLAMNIAGRTAIAGFQVIFASLEQGVFIIPRLKSIFGDHPEMIKNLKFIVPDELPKVDDFIKTFEDPDSRPKLLIVDHLHYFQRGNRGATEEMDRLVIDLQSMAKRLEIPVIVIAHVRKLKDEKPPTMEDLKDSSSLSQIPGVVAMMHREPNPKELIANGDRVLSDNGVLFIYKNRIFGKTGAEKFKIYETGEIVFDRTPEDRANLEATQVRLDMPESFGIPGLEYLDD